jgi:hypothetical protein
MKAKPATHYSNNSTCPQQTLSRIHSSFFPGSIAAVGQGLLSVEVSRSHSDTIHSAGFLWTRNQPDAKTSTLQHRTLRRQISMPPAGFEPPIPASAWPQTHVLDGAATGIGQETEIHTCNMVTILPNRQVLSPNGVNGRQSANRGHRLNSVT